MKTLCRISRLVAAATLMLALSPTIAARADSTPASATPQRGVPVRYSAPVDRRVIDLFRMENGPYGAGNRGLKYDTHGGEPVLATASGNVTFAGQVGGRLAITLRHADGRLSSVTGIDRLGVVAGALVLGGDVLGIAAPRLHFGIRQDGRYIDPATLIRGSSSGGRRTLYLVPLGGMAER